jgi:hypothetical protein
LAIFNHIERIHYSERNSLCVLEMANETATDTAVIRARAAGEGQTNFVGLFGSGTGSNNAHIGWDGWNGLCRYSVGMRIISAVTGGYGNNES